jgi:hypothetical protein
LLLALGEARMSTSNPLIPSSPSAPHRGPSVGPSRGRPAEGPATRRAPDPVFSTSNRERLQALGLSGGVDPFDTPQWEAGGAFDALHRGLP